MAEEKTNPLLELDTHLLRQHIKVDGKPYALRRLDEFMLLERHQMGQAAEAMKGIAKMGQADVSDDEFQRAIDGLHGCFRAIVVDAEELIDRLTDDQKGKVLEVFFVQPATDPDAAVSPPSKPPLAS